jgi:hypothetical protein
VNPGFESKEPEPPMRAIVALIAAARQMAGLHFEM